MCHDVTLTSLMAVLLLFLFYSPSVGIQYVPSLSLSPSQNKERLMVKFINETHSSEGQKGK